METNMSKRQRSENDLLTAEEVAKICKVSPVTVRWWLREGRLPSERFGAMRLARRKVVMEWKQTWKDRYPVGHPFKD